MKQNKQKKRRSLKGMTLVEIVIALFIFSLMALMMARLAEVVVSLNRNANQVNRKTAAQAPIAEMQNTNGNVSDLENDNLRISVTVAGKTVSVTSKSYTTAKTMTGDPAAAAAGDLEFVQIDLNKFSGDGIYVPPTEVETEEPTT
ncbi:MAG: prepilin-type N-terminal cleavage/methylation domain-containing protein [Oscillospiraceae bacterium]|nr:prepilin-type N-terminal cleavage/methylation domain-containing protein [Oscillospiraceae bacterium]